MELVQVIATAWPLTPPALNQLAAQPGVSPFLPIRRGAEEPTRDLAPQLNGQPTASSSLATLLSLGPPEQLFRHALQAETRLRAGDVLVVPPPHAGMDIRPRTPAGMEPILGLCAPEGHASAVAIPIRTRDLAALLRPASSPSPGPVMSAAATVCFVES